MTNVFMSLLYLPALPFVVIGAVCNYICRCVVGGFLIGWRMSSGDNERSGR